MPARLLLPRLIGVILLLRCPDPVGQPRSAENDASHLPSSQAEEHGESGTVTASVERGNSMTNSIRPLRGCDRRCALLPHRRVHNPAPNTLYHTPPLATTLLLIGAVSRGLCLTHHDASGHVPAGEECA